MIEQAFRTSAGITINLVASAHHGPPIVLLHGVTRRWQDWLTVLPYLTPRYHVLALDLRGHGRSDRAPGAYRIADYVPDLVDFLSRGLTEPALILGHSLGGNLAAMLAAEAPDLVRGIVLEDPPLDLAGERIVETAFPPLFRVYSRHAGSPRPAEAIAAELAEAIVTAPGRPGPFRLGDVRDGLALRSSAASLKWLDPEVLTPPLEGRWLDGSDVAASLRGVACPALLLQADPSCGGALPDAEAGAMASLLADGLLVKFPGVGHQIHAAAPEAMMRSVLPFLGTLE